MTSSTRREEAGILFGTLIMFYAFVNSAAAGGDFPMQFGVLLVPVLYVSVAWAIARHELFDVDRIVRQSFVYATLSAVLVPLVVSGNSVGLLLLGPRRSGKPFDANDAALLRTLAGQTAIPMQNALSWTEPALAFS